MLGHGAGLGRLGLAALILAAPGALAALALAAVHGLLLGLLRAHVLLHARVHDAVAPLHVAGPLHALGRRVLLRHHVRHLLLRLHLRLLVQPAGEEGYRSLNCLAIKSRDQPVIILSIGTPTTSHVEACQNYVIKYPSVKRIALPVM